MRTLQERAWNGERVLVQTSMDVPQDGGRITDDARLRASVPTLSFLLDRGCSLILCGHVGRPKGERKPELSTQAVAQAYAALLGREVRFCPEATGPEARAQAQALAPGGVLVLENLRFDPREEATDEGFARELASLADAFVNDDYPDAHRRTACNVLVPALLPSHAGFSLAAEYAAVSAAVEDPAGPLTLIVGGAKADKIGIINSLLHRADTIIVGGVLANTFLKASGVDVKGSRIDDRSVEIAGEFLRDSEERFLLPVDAVAADRFSDDAQHKEVPVQDIPEKWLIMDIGTHTLERYAEAIERSGTVIWGGPIGVFEWKPFSRGTEGVAQAMARAKGYTLVAGGDSGAAVHALGLEGRMKHVSIGGGATLALIGGETLPAVEALRN